VCVAVDALREKASYVFGVEVKKAENPAAADVKDTAELGRQWKPQAPEHGK
jgi:hypothetical protein